MSNVCGGGGGGGGGGAQLLSPKWVNKKSHTAVAGVGKEAKEVYSVQNILTENKNVPQCTILDRLA